MTLGIISAQSGESFTVSNGKVVCNFDGYVLVGANVYINSYSGTGLSQWEIVKNSTYLGGAAGEVKQTYALPPQIVQVNIGDTFALSGRSWSDSVSFTISPGNFTWMAIVKL